MSITSENFTPPRPPSGGLQYLFECGANMAIFLYEVFLLKLSIAFLKLLYKYNPSSGIII